MMQEPLIDQGLLVTISSRSHTDTHTRTQSVGFLRKSDRPVVDNSTWKYTTSTRDSHQCPHRYSNPHF